MKTKGFRSYCSKKCKNDYNDNRKKREAKVGTSYPGVGKSPKPDEIIFGNYKEPLKKVKKKDGHGYYGVVMYSRDRKMIQCHICGKMYRSLGSHVLGAHGVTVDKYREDFDLAASTKLIGEETRDMFVDSYNQTKRKYLKGWLEKDPEERRQQIILANKNRVGSKMRLEIKNKRGSCPDQLLDKIRKLKRKLGKVPSVKDFKREYNQKFVGTIYYTFGSWGEACKLAGLKSQKAQHADRYSRKNLIRYMQDFYKRNNRTPTNSDMERGLLPSANTYRRKFGQLNQARYEAGIPLLVISKGHYIQTMDYTKFSSEINIL